MDGNGQVPVVEVHDLVKRYRKGKVNAVDGVSFAVRRGEVFGLLGPNGAGKTTTVGILTTRVRRTGGTASVSGVDVGVDPVRARRLVAVVPQRNNLDRSLSIRQNLLFHAAYHGVPAAELADRVGIMDHGKLLALDALATMTRWAWPPENMSGLSVARSASPNSSSRTSARRARSAAGTPW